MMRPLKSLTIGSVIAAASATHAMACCDVCGSPCVAPAPVVAAAPLVVVQPAAPYYVVNQGPVYSGPGIMTYPGYFNEVAAPTFYPYVSVDYYAPYFESHRHPYAYRSRPGFRGPRPYGW